MAKSRKLTIYLKTPRGGLATYETREEQAKDLVDKFDAVIDWFYKQGWESYLPNTEVQKPVVESNNNTQNICPVHNIEMKEIDGKYGKFYSHAKQIEGEWVYCKGKGWGK